MDPFDQPLPPVVVLGPPRSPPCPRCNSPGDVLPGQPRQPNPRPEPGGTVSYALICPRCNWRWRVTGAEYIRWRTAAQQRPPVAGLDAYTFMSPARDRHPESGLARGWKLVRKLLTARHP